MLKIRLMSDVPSQAHGFEGQSLEDSAPLEIGMSGGVDRSHATHLMAFPGEQVPSHQGPHPGDAIAKPGEEHD